MKKQKETKKRIIPYIGKKIDNSAGIAPGQKQFALALPKSVLNGLESKLPDVSDAVVYYPECIKKHVNSKGAVNFKIKVVYLDAPTKQRSKQIDLNQLMLGRNQLRVIRYENPEASNWYKEEIKKISGRGHMAMTAPTTIANDGELRQSVFSPNELVMYNLNTLTLEGDSMSFEEAADSNEDSIGLNKDTGNIAFYSIGVHYLRNNAFVRVATELDKLILTAEQLKEIRKKDWQAASWYQNQKGISSSNAYVKNQSQLSEEE